MRSSSPPNFGGDYRVPEAIRPDASKARRQDLNDGMCGEALIYGSVNRRILDDQVFPE